MRPRYLHQKPCWAASRTERVSVLSRGRPSCCSAPVLRPPPDMRAPHCTGPGNLCCVLQELLRCRESRRALSQAPPGSPHSPSRALCAVAMTWVSCMWSHVLSQDQPQRSAAPLWGQCSKFLINKRINTSRRRQIRSRLLPHSLVTLPHRRKKESKSVLGCAEP